MVGSPVARGGALPLSGGLNDSPKLIAENDGEIAGVRFAERVRGCKSRSSHLLVAVLVRTILDPD